MTLQLRGVFILFFAFTISGFAQSNCRELRGCERKICELKTKLTYAKQYGRTEQIRGLEKAITEVESKCYSGNGTYASELEKKIKSKEKKVQERTIELNQAIQERQKSEKIEKKKKKLAEAQYELEMLKKNNL